MTIIDKYILKQYLTTFGTMLLLFVPIGIMLNLAEQIGKMIDNEAPLNEILIYYLNFTIYIGSLLFPIFLFLSIIFFSLSSFLLLSYKNSYDNTEKAVIRYFSGLVWDEDGEPLHQVVIFLPELNLADTTSNQGRFVFNIFDTLFCLFPNIF